MTVATYTTNLATILIEFPNTTGWTALGGGPAGLNAPETDYFIQGANCITKNAFASNTRGMIWDSTSDQGGSGTDGAYVAWLTHTAPNSLDTKAGAGMQVLIGSGSGDFEQYYVGGSDTMTFLKWVFVAVNEATAGDATTGSPSTTAEQFFGALWDLPSGGPTKGAPNAIDAIRFGRCDAIIEFGTSADPEADFDAALSTFDSTTNRYGLLTQREPGGAIENSGLIQFGTSTNAVEFTDSGKTINIRDHDHVTANFNTWEANNASSIIIFTNLVVKALGTTSPGRWVTNNNATLTWTTCNFTDMGAFTFDTNSTIDTCTFLDCGVITHGGGTLNGSSILQSAVAADDGAMFYDETADPDGEMDNMTFSQGTNAHHAIRFGTTVPASITLRGCDFTGFSSSDDVDGSVFRFDDTSGNITLNLVGCTTDGAFSVDDAAGVTVTVVIDPVTSLVNVKDNTGANLQNARVIMEADLPVAVAAGGTGYTVGDVLTVVGGTGTAATLTVTTASSGVVTAAEATTGGAYSVNPTNPVSVTGGTGSSATFNLTFSDLPFNENVTSITRSGTVATVTHTAHGLNTSDKVKIKGITDKIEDNNGVQAVASVPTANSYTYTTTDSGSTSYTGTIIATGVVFEGDTDASGNISRSRTYTLDQPITGRARFSTSSPRLKTFDLAGTIDNADGLTINVQMIIDE